MDEVEIINMLEKVMRKASFDSLVSAMGRKIIVDKVESLFRKRGESDIPSRTQITEHYDKVCANEKERRQRNLAMKIGGISISLIIISIIVSYLQ